MIKALVAVTCLVGAVLSPARAQQTMPDMPGMQVQQPNRQQTKPDPMPADIQGMGQDKGDAKARAAAQSEKNSVQQQSAASGAKPADGSDAKSLTVPVQQMQEPEAIGFQTGADLPAPELLGDVVKQPPMTLESFIGLAEKSNPTLVEAQRNIDRSGQQARQASLPPDPVIGYSGDHIRGGEYHGGEEGAFFSQEFVLGRKLALRRDIFRAEGKSNEFALAIQRARVHDDVGRSFFDALTAQATVVLRERLLKVAEDAETNAHELERVGQADAPDVLNAELAAEQAKVDFVQAQRMFLASFSQLATHAGQAALAAHPLAGGLVEPPDVDAEAMVNLDVAESPAVKRAEANVQVAEARLKSAKREAVPDLNVKAGEWYSGEELNNGREAGPMSFAEAGVQIPLWNRNQGNAEAAKVELERARQEVTRTQLMTRNRAEPFAQQYLTARFTADRYRTEILPRARRAYQLQVTKYQQMAQSYPPVLEAQKMLFTLQMTYLHALDEEWQAAIALENFALENGLDEPMSVGQDATDVNLPTGGTR